MQSCFTGLLDEIIHLIYDEQIKIFSQYMEHADRILALDKDGKQIFYGTYIELQKREDIFKTLTASIGESNDGRGEEVVEKDSDLIREGRSGSVEHSYDDVIPPPTVSRIESGTETETGSVSLSRSSTPLSDVFLSDSQSISPSLSSSSDMLNIMELEMTAPNNDESVKVGVDTYPLSYQQTLDQKKNDRKYRSKKSTKAPHSFQRGANYDRTLSSRGKLKRDLKEGKNIDEKADTQIKREDKSLLARLLNLFTCSRKLKGTNSTGNAEVQDSESHDISLKSVSQIIVSEDRVEGRLSYQIWKQYMKSGKN